MKKEDLENLVLEGLSTRDISEKTGKSQTTVRNWLKKLNLKTKRTISKESDNINTKNKDFTISHLKAYTFNERVKKELDKCILVCNRCHREIHAKLIQIR